MSQQLTFDLNVDNKQAIDSINTFFEAFDAGVKDVGQRMDQQLKQKNVKVEMRLEGGKLVAKEINNAASAGNRLEKAANVISGKFGQTAREVNNSVALLKTMVASTNKYKNNTKELNDDWKQLVQLLREARQEARDFQVSDQPERSITGANIAAGLALDAIRGLANGFRNLVSEGVEMEVLMIQLKGFTGSTEAAEKAFNDFLRIAAATPFNVTQIAEGARTMMGFGISASDATHRIEQLAIVAAATGGELTHMARNLGQIQANQRAYTRDLMQFANQGIPIYQMLADVLGLSTQQVRELAEEGEIGFNEVAAALDRMTEKGSAFYQIAQEMDKTIAARLEALQGTISATAGKFIEMVQGMDTALGGPLTKSFAFLIEAVSAVGDGLTVIKKNAEKLAPVIVALGTIIAGAMGVALIQNLAVIAAGFKLWIAQIMATKIALIALNTVQAIFNALTGNVAALALAAGVATLGFVAYKNATKEAADETDKLNSALKEEQFSANADSADLLAFNIEDVTGATRRLIEAEKERYDESKKGYDLAVGQMERALGFLERDAEERKANHEAEMSRIKEKIEAEKQGMKDALEASKSVHSTKMEDLKQELQAVRDRYAEELGELDKQSMFAKELEGIRRKEIQDKLATSNLSRKETLELREQLHQMDNRVKRRELLAKKAEEEKVIQDKIAAAEKEHRQALEDIKEEYEGRVTALEEALQTEQGSIDQINSELQAQADKISQFKAQERQAIFENRDAAISSINEQIVKANDLRVAMQNAYNTARRANSEASRLSSSGRAPGSGSLSARASGGPVSGGSSYQVNELGKEAFLSAAGRLSMINAPSFGTWKAPNSGTVIPAHLTKQLDVPSGGINLNSAAGANAAKAGGGMSAMVRAIRGSMSGGDTFNQSVTVQSDNPTQTANNMMVEMTRLKRRRFR